MRLPVLIDNPANEAIHSITGRDYLSYSQVTMYQSCPLKWWFNYVAQLPHEQVSSGLLFGSGMHAAIEAHFKAILTGGELPSMEMMMHVFDSAWNESARAPVVFGKDEDRADSRELAGRMLTAFLESDIARPEGTVLGIEEEVRGPITASVPDLLARIDLILLTDDAVVIRDFKTSRSSWNEKKVAESAAQLVLYGHLSASIAENFEDLPIRREFVVMTKTKVPAIECHVVDDDLDELARTKSIVRQVYRSMIAGHVYPNPSPLNCAGCPFQRACRTWCG